ncbi:hypothetical protein [Idiomarina abyssalis]|uniref:hypothetical protein n=1 Tax=Idiomarina abyssalis TaxID=86102 RepID=UPI003A941A31
MKQYITFGQSHSHRLGDTLFDKDCVATFPALNGTQGRRLAFKIFGDKFCFHYADQPPFMEYFPRGFVEIPLDIRKAALQSLIQESEEASEEKDTRG